MALNINNTAVTDYSSIDANAFDIKEIDGIQDIDETIYQNERFGKDWAAFMKIPKLSSAIIMKAIWSVGKGYTCDPEIRIRLNRIKGNGKQTFTDILFNMVVGMQVGRDSFAEIVRDEESGEVINIKILDPSSIRIVYGRNGLIKRYEQSKGSPTKSIVSRTLNYLKSKISPDAFETFKPNEIFHLSRHCLCGSTHGISVPESVEEIILADDENFKIMKKLTRFQAVPFIMFKVKSDNPSTIATFKTNIKTARDTGDDLIIPDDENLLSWEVVQVSPSAVLMEWRNSLNNEFLQAVGMPHVLFGGGGTEANGKTAYLGHETIFENDQRYIEQQVEAQLGFKIELNSPTSLLENLQTDETKDNQNALTFQQNDIQAGVGA